MGGGRAGGTHGHEAQLSDGGKFLEENKMKDASTGREGLSEGVTFQKGWGERAQRGRNSRCKVAGHLMQTWRNTDQCAHAASPALGGTR